MEMKIPDLTRQSIKFHMEWILLMKRCSTPTNTSIQILDEYNSVIDLYIQYLKKHKNDMPMYMLATPVMYRQVLFESYHENFHPPSEDECIVCKIDIDDTMEREEEEGESMWTITTNDIEPDPLELKQEVMDEGNDSDSGSNLDNSFDDDYARNSGREDGMELGEQPLVRLSKLSFRKPPTRRIKLPKKGKPHQCRHGCDRFNQDARVTICTNFHTMDYESRKNYILNLVETHPTKSFKVTASKERSKTLYYHLEDKGERVRVCGQFFYQTLRIGQCFVEDALSRKGPDGKYSGQDRRGKYKRGWKKKLANLKAEKLEREKAGLPGTADNAGASDESDMEAERETLPVSSSPANTTVSTAPEPSTSYDMQPCDGGRLNDISTNSSCSLAPGNKEVQPLIPYTTIGPCGPMPNPPLQRTFASNMPSVLPGNPSEYNLPAPMPKLPMPLNLMTSTPQHMHPEAATDLYSNPPADMSFPTLPSTPFTDWSMLGRLGSSDLFSPLGQGYGQPMNYYQPSPYLENTNPPTSTTSQNHSQNQSQNQSQSEPKQPAASSSKSETPKAKPAKKTEKKKPITTSFYTSLYDKWDNCSCKRSCNKVFDRAAQTEICKQFMVLDKKQQKEFIRSHSRMRVQKKQPEAPSENKEIEAKSFNYFFYKDQVAHSVCFLFFMKTLHISKSYIQKATREIAKDNVLCESTGMLRRRSPTMEAGPDWTEEQEERTTWRGSKDPPLATLTTSTHKCSFNCCEIFNEEKQLEIRQSYKLLDYKGRKNFILRLVRDCDVKSRKREVVKRRQYQVVYYLPTSGPLRRVCKKFFVKVLQIGDYTIQHAIRRKAADGNFHDEDGRGFQRKLMRLRKEKAAAL